MNHWKNIQVIATDIDGTLTTEGSFSQEVVGALHNLKQTGFRLILVTGRPSGWVQGLVSYLPVDAAIAENGGVIFRGAETSPLLRSEKTGDYHEVVDASDTRRRLAEVFAILKATHPLLRVTEDNAFRLSDYTFHVSGISQNQLLDLKAQVESLGCAFTWSTIHAHIMPTGQEKGSALSWLLQKMGCPVLPAHSTLTVGDSPNDLTLFDEQRFPNSAGVANIEKYRSVMNSFPRIITQKSEGKGFVEIAQSLLSLKGVLL